MANIHVLDQQMANLIAAGEVVDRPASVIKELCENAMDAGATAITIEIQNGGTTFMRVSDNGCGIDPEDLPVAILRHATSKVKTEGDLNRIATLGFRGEALAAIAAVSKLRIISKQAWYDTGFVLESEGGVVQSVTETGAKNGTTVIVEELFANVPARRKFLKRDATETLAVSSLVEKMVLSRPDIAFKFITDGTLRLSTDGDNKLINAIYATLGREFAAKTIPLDYLSSGIRVLGYIGRPDMVRTNRNFQNFFINGRFVKSKTVLAALEQAYSSYIPSDKFPCCVLMLEIPYYFVDVNVHPTKLEVKFSDEKKIFEAVYYAVRSALESRVRTPQYAKGGIAKADISKGDIGSERIARAVEKAKAEEGRKLVSAFSPIDDRTAKSGAAATPTASATAVPMQAPAAPKVEQAPQKSAVPAADPAEAVLAAAMQEAADSLSALFEPVAPVTAVTSDPAATAALKAQEDAEKEQYGPRFRLIDAKKYPMGTPEGMTPEAVLQAEDAARKAIASLPDEQALQESDPAASLLLRDELPQNEEIGALPAAGTDVSDIAVPQLDSTPIMTYTQIKAAAERAEQPVSLPTEQTAEQPPAPAPHGEEGLALPYYRIIGELFNSYVLIEQEDTVLLMDKHAAHERLLFEEMKKNMLSPDLASQVLLLPERIPLSPAEFAALEEFEREVRAIGFEFAADAAAHEMTVTAIPLNLDIRAAADLMTEILGRLSDGTGNIRVSRDTLYEKALYQASCKAAIKAGRIYAEENIKWLCDKVLSLPGIRFCPHGRPVLIELSRHELEKMFKRI